MQESKEIFLEKSPFMFFAQRDQEVTEPFLMASRQSSDDSNDNLFRLVIKKFTLDLKTIIDTQIDRWESIL